MNSTPPTSCPVCGQAIPADSQHRLCPACLMAQALASQTIDPGGEKAAAVAPPSPEEMADRFPQFEITECLGRGGMGVVYKARQKSLDRWVAIKILAPERVGQERFAERFTREAQMLARLSHPNIVTVFDHGETGGLYYFVMEFVDGVNLRDLLRDGKLEAKQALAIVPPICEALQYAHEKGIVHRDIKPENLLLDREGRVKIADFGIAALVGAEGESAGTPPYMAPEQSRRASEVDSRADIYALGVVLYEMLTGERPDKEVIAPSRKVRIDVRLDEIVMRALERNPELRWQTAVDLRTEVETIAATPPGSAAPPAPEPEPDLPPDLHSRVAPPGVAMMVVSGWHLLSSVFGLAWFGFILMTMRHEVMAGKAGHADFNFPAWLRALLSSAFLDAPRMIHVMLGIVLAWMLVWVAASAVTFAGGWRMCRLRSHKLALAGALLLFLQAARDVAFQDGVFGHWNVVWFIARIGAGLWALIVLLRPEVRAAFARAAIAGPAPREPMHRASRFSRTAIVGVLLCPFVPVLAALGFVVFRHNAAYVFPNGRPIPNTPARLLEVGLLCGAVLCAFGCTLLGWIAVSQIRRSAGKLHGLGLAVFDGLVFPLLALDALVYAGAIAVYFGIIAPFGYNGHGDAAPLTVMGGLLLGSSAMVVLADSLIIWWVWRAVNRPVAAPESSTQEAGAAQRILRQPFQHVYGSQKPDRFWRWFAVTVLALIMIPIVLSIFGIVAAIAITGYNAPERRHAEEIAGYPTELLRTVTAPPFTATYPGGTVELVALDEFPQTQKPAWLPDGSASAAPFPKESGSYWASGKQVRLLSVRVRSHDKEASHPILKLDSDSPNAFMGYSCTNNPDYDETIERLAIDPGAQSVNFQIGVADGAWETVSTLKPFGDATLPNGFQHKFASETVGDWQSGVDCIVAKDGSMTMSFRYSEKEGYESQMVEVRTDGSKETFNSGPLDGSGGLMKGMTAFTAGDAARIVAFESQRRPYQWVAFHNVSVKPGYRTTVEVEDSGGSPSGAP